MGNESKVTPLTTRLHIGTNMPVTTVLQKGNACQKAVAYVFDFNGDGKYQENEAATFNSVRIRQHSKDNYTIWQENNGKQTATHLRGDFSKTKFAPNRDINPHPPTQKKTAAAQAGKTQATIDVDRFVKEGKGTLVVDTYPNGVTKSKTYKSKDKQEIIAQEFYENGTPKSEKVTVWKSKSYKDTKDIQYYPNGKVKTSFTQDLDQNKKYFNEFYENGNPKSQIVEKWKPHAEYRKRADGKYEWFGKYVEITNIQYDSNGNVTKIKK